MKRHWVTIRQAPGDGPDDPRLLLEQTLDAAGFWPALEAVRRQQRLRRDRFAIVIKPDLDVYDLAVAAATDPDLVGHLAALLNARGFRRVSVLDLRNGNDGWLLNREPRVVADLAGYDFSGACYSVSADPDAWASAAFRINFASNKTHEAWAYALCVHNLSGVLTGVAPVSSPGDVAERCLQVLRTAPPHFNLIDAYVSCHGAAGQRAPKALATCTFIASPDALLADLAGASKMGLDPYASPVNARVLRSLGLPEGYQIDGALTPYPLWQNVHPLLADSARRRSEAEVLGTVTEAWFQRVDRQHFPFREFHHDRMNAFIAPLLERIGDDARATWLVVLLNYAIAYVGNAVLAQYTLFSKDKLARRTDALTIDLEGLDEAAYTVLPGYLAGFERLLTDYPGGRYQQRLRRVDGAVLFSGAMELPIEYGQFVRRVSIERAIQYMNDYIGGSTITVAADNRGRVRRQAERNLYLQQPNWMVLFGGDVIDVEKLELIEYARDSRTIYWRTVNSPNASAECDDGRVSFRRTPGGHTRVEIFTRQKFALPLFFHVAHIDLLPGVRDPIVERAYHTFFTRTMTNLQAEYEGRAYRAGHDPQLPGRGEGSMKDLARYFATAMATLAELLRHRADFAGLEQWVSARTWTRAPAAAPAQDADGFRHFGATPAGTRYDRSGDEPDYFRQLEAVLLDAPGFLTGLAEAVQRDFERFAGADGTPDVAATEGDPRP